MEPRKFEMVVQCLVHSVTSADLHLKRRNSVHGHRRIVRAMADVYSAVGQMHDSIGFGIFWPLSTSQHLALEGVVVMSFPSGWRGANT